MLELKNVFKTYKSKKGIETKALKNVSFKTNNNGIIFVLGKSGCGKSTLLNVIGGLDNFDDGDILVDGKSIKNLSKNKYDEYRNSYIGFVFQDYNLLDELNVYQNINLSLQLQNKNDDLIDETLKKVEIEDLKTRKINELSGGQKQRVAIARALVKKPKILLCDEPTGNLDSVSSKQVFDLLKEISKEQLVIVVTHDLENAKKYADRIIQIKDGEIVNDSNTIENGNNNNDTVSWSKSKLPFKFKTKLALNILLSKKLKLIFSFILLVASLIGFGVLNSLVKIDRDEKILETYKDSTGLEQDVLDTNVYIRKYDKYYSNEDYLFGKTSDDPMIMRPTIMTEDVKQKAESLTNQKWNYEYNIVQNGEYEKIEFPNNKIQANLYFEYSDFIPSFVEVEDEKTAINEEIIGRMPNNYSEIVITSYIADSIINGGIKLSNDEIYLPKSYEQIINDSKEIKFGDTNIKFKIVGVVNYDLNRYQKLKQYSYGDYDNNDIINLHEDFDDAFSIYSRIFVKKGFINNLNLPSNNILKSEYLKMIYKENIESYDAIGFVTNDMNVYTNKISKGYNLNDNEIIISLEMLNKITNGDFKEKFNKYLYSNNTITDNEKTNFIINYINSNKIINSTILTDINDNVQTFSKEEYKEYKIVGVDLNLTNDISIIYYNNKQVNKMIGDTNSSVEIYSIITNVDTLKALIDEIPVDSGYIITSTSYSSFVVSIYMTTLLINKFLYQAVVIISILQILILVNLILTSINNKKKQIGILKALGTTDKDIFTIFVFESLIIVLISIIVSVFGINFANRVINKIFMEEGFLNFDVFVFGISELIKMIILSIIIVLLTSLLSIKKITKIKPVDVINDK